MDLYGAEFNKFIATNFFIILETEDFETPKTLERVETDIDCPDISNLNISFR